MIQADPKELALARDILRAHLPGAKIWAFGSRTRGGARRGSDLDLAIDAGAPLSSSAKAQLAVALDEAALPFNVDPVDLHNISDEFRALIDAHKIPFPGFE